MLEEIWLNKNKEIIDFELPYYSPELKLSLLKIELFNKYETSNVFSLGLTFLQTKLRLSKG